MLETLVSNPLISLGRGWLWFHAFGLRKFGLLSGLLNERCASKSCALETLRSPLLCVFLLTPKVTKEDWSSAHGPARSDPPVNLVRRTFGRSIKREIFSREGGAHMWPLLDDRISDGELHISNESCILIFFSPPFKSLSGVFKHRLRVVTSPCERERRALCHAERLSVSPGGADRGGRTFAAMPGLERRGPAAAAHQLLQQVPGQPGGRRALLQEVRGGERSLARGVPPSDCVPVQRQRPEAAAHFSGGALGQQLRFPVWCPHLHHQQPREGFFLRVLQQGHLARRYRTPRGHRGSAGVETVRGMRDVPLPQVQPGQVEGPE